MIKKNILSVAILVAVLVCISVSHAADAVVIPVDSAAFVFSPGNWVGDQGRGGKLCRQTWNAGAYFRVTWESNVEEETVTLLLKRPSHLGLAGHIDGAWQAIPKETEAIDFKVQGKGKHVLTVFMNSSPEKERWGSRGKAGVNTLQIKGLRIGAGSKPMDSPPQKKWALIVGDSITEGIGVNAIQCYSSLVGQGLQELGYEYGVSACGWSGWLNRGDRPPGDVPGYYVVKGATDGQGGEYVDAESRWNKIDASNSLLDSQGRISAYGKVSQEPSLIMINYGTNEHLHKQDKSDRRASVAQCLRALRKAAPTAKIVLLIPFGQYMRDELYEAVAKYPNDKKIFIIDLGQNAANALQGKSAKLWGGLHPNANGHANFAVKVLAKLTKIENQ